MPVLQQAKDLGRLQAQFVLVAGLPLSFLQMFYRYAECKCYRAMGSSSGDAIKAAWKPGKYAVALELPQGTPHESEAHSSVRAKLQ